MDNKKMKKKKLEIEYYTNNASDWAIIKNIDASLRRFRLPLQINKITITTLEEKK